MLDSDTFLKNSMKKWTLGFYEVKSRGKIVRTMNQAPNPLNVREYHTVYLRMAVHQASVPKETNVIDK